MIDYSIQNKKAWEYNAYDFWVKEAGMPADRAKKIVANPSAALKRYANYFDTYKGIRVANICGSCGKKAVPLAVLGADVTVFDISEDNKRYALELADVAGVRIDYQVCDEIVALNDGSYIMLEDGKTTLYGEAYMIKDRQQRQICKDGEFIFL